MSVDLLRYGAAWGLFADTLVAARFDRPTRPAGLRARAAPGDPDGDAHAAGEYRSPSAADGR